MSWEQYYDQRLLKWNSLRQQCKELSQLDSLIAINNWFKYAPLVSSYLNIHDYLDFPTPWELIHDNIFCELSKCLGMAYTYLLLDKPYETMLLLKDNYGYILRVDDYVLNLDPSNVLNTKQIDTDIIFTLDCELITTKVK